MVRKPGNELKVTPWKIAASVAIAIFAAFQLYQWYATGLIYARRVGPQHYIPTQNIPSSSPSSPRSM
jgi:hypothetical protein